MRSPGFSPISAARRPTECGFCASVGAEASVKIDHRNPRDPRAWSVRIDDLPRARAAKLRFLAAGAARAERSACTIFPLATDPTPRHRSRKHLSLEPKLRVLELHISKS